MIAVETPITPPPSTTILDTHNLLLGTSFCCGTRFDSGAHMPSLLWYQNAFDVAPLQALRPASGIVSHAVGQANIGRNTESLCSRARLIALPLPPGLESRTVRRWPLVLQP